MSSPPALDLAAALGTLDGWTLRADGTALQKTFLFRTFSGAWGFMSRCALVAEKHDHHPDWFNSWNRVEVTLTTHSVGTVTERDVKLARAMNRIAREETTPDTPAASA